MNTLRFLSPSKRMAQAIAVFALAGLSACNAATDPAANNVAANQNGLDATSRDDATMEGDGRMHNEMSGRAQGDGSMSSQGRMNDDAMGGSGVGPANGGANSGSPMNNDAMPPKKENPPMMDDDMMMKNDM